MAAYILPVLGADAARGEKHHGLNGRLWRFWGGGVRVPRLSVVIGRLKDARNVSVLAGEAISVGPSRANTCVAGVFPPGPVAPRSRRRVDCASLVWVWG